MPRGATRHYHNKHNRLAIPIPHDGTFTELPENLQPLATFYHLHEQLQWLHASGKHLDHVSQRCLLEWMFSYRTPTELRKAVGCAIQIGENDLKEIAVSLMQQSTSCWKYPVYSLHCLLQYHVVNLETPDILEFLDSQILRMPFLLLFDDDHRVVYDPETIQSMDEAIYLATIVKDVLIEDTEYDCSSLNAFLFRLLKKSKWIPVDKLSVVSIALGRTIQQEFDLSHVVEQAGLLPELPRATFFQGLAATLPVSTDIAVCIFENCLRLSQSSDPEMRVAALKAIRTLIQRFPQSVVDSAQILDLVLLAWENPPTRKLEHTVADCFDTLVQYMKAHQQNLDGLIQRLLEQPAFRKAKYTALEQLLPAMDVSLLVSNQALVGNLVKGVGDHGHNNGAIAELWAKILAKLHRSVDNWDSIPWMGPFLEGLTDTELSRRKKVAAFCLPKICTIANDSKPDSGKLFADILLGLRRIHTEDVLLSKEREILADRVLWAMLEVTRYANLDGLFIIDHFGLLFKAVQETLPMDRLRQAMLHSSPSIRVAAFSVSGTIVFAHDKSRDQLSCLERELQLWKMALPFSLKIEVKEDLASLMLCLIHFLDRLLKSEAALNDSFEKPDVVLPNFLCFVSSFLLDDLVLKRAGYPGTASCKEIFVLSFVELLIVFSCREHPLTRANKLIPQSSPLLNRKRSLSESRSLGRIITRLLELDVFAVLFRLLYSRWDPTRIQASRVLTGLVQLARISAVELPEACRAERELARFEAIGIQLASSPRQRDADTGARILAFVFCLINDDKDRYVFMFRLVDLLEQRLVEIKQKLLMALSTGESSKGIELPLAYGVVSALRLVMCGPMKVDPTLLSKLFERMAALFCKAIRISVSVVADVREGISLDGMDEELTLGVYQSGSKQVNPGAIGANGIFSSVVRASTEERTRREASQRIVVGTWLLTKETCAAISTLFTHRNFQPSLDMMNDAGMLLINTLTSLKHTGAAFAAHRTLQDICKACLQSSEEHKNLPYQWTTRLLDEVSNPDKIRDSTLRRSQGYSLGFLALLRSEITSRCSARPLCSRVMKELVRLSMPSKSRVISFCSMIQLEGVKSLLATDQEVLEPVHDHLYGCRSRVHALNSLRFILQDASLWNVVFPFVGLCMISSVMGYVDDEWSVRNSATMVMASAMLRSIDSNKNALNKDLTSENATTANELFKAYPSLAGFLLSILKANVAEVFGDMKASLPPLLPILLLFSRIQPVLHSSRDSVSDVEAFIPVMFRCLRNRRLSVRRSAAKALRNLASINTNSESSLSAMVDKCVEDIEQCRKDHDWNYMHGCLLLILELSNSFVEARVLAKNAALSEKLLSTVRNKAGIFEVPPPCVSVTVQILSILEITDEGPKLQPLLSALVGRFKQNKSDGPSSAGSATLGVVTGSNTAILLSKHIWSDPGYVTKAATSLDTIEDIFLSPSVDVRLGAIKAFKKHIYSGLDRTMHESLDSENLLRSVTTVVLKALKFELKLENHANYLSLRRLSRCLLECINHGALETLQDTTIQSFLRDISVALQSKYRVNEDPISFLTTLRGNCVELHSALGKKICNSEEILKEMTASVSAIARYRNWRCRYSAACALRHLCHPLTREIDRHFDVCFLWLTTWGNLMQDEDADVRQAALECLGNSYSVQELRLQQGYWSVCDSMPCEDVVDFACKELLVLTKPISVVLENLIAQKGKRPGNIFQSEVSDSYYEICLAAQLAVSAACRSLQRKGPNESYRKRTRESVDALLKRSENVLSRLQRVTVNATREILNVASAGALFRDITTDSNLFGHLHNMLLGAALAILVSRHSGSTYNSDMISRIGVIGDSLYMLRGTAACTASLHPSVVEAAQLTVLAVDADVESVVKALRKSCFLIGESPPMQ